MLVNYRFLEVPQNAAPLLAPSFAALSSVLQTYDRKLCKSQVTQNCNADVAPIFCKQRTCSGASSGLLIDPSPLGRLLQANPQGLFDMLHT